MITRFPDGGQIYGLNRTSVVLMVDEPNKGQLIVDAQGCDYLLYTRREEPTASSGMTNLLT
jgi:hypothetical protein